MSTTRFSFNEIASRTAEALTPPYWVTEQNGQNGQNALNTPMSQETIFANALGIPMTMPLRIADNDGPRDYWMIPVEPTITVTGKNLITRRQVSKGKVRGSIKERWNQDDYSIKISGVLFNPLSPEEYPEKDVKMLREYCERGKLSALCPLLAAFSIEYLVVESYEFPFTSGKGNQAYSIQAYSDNIHNLLLEGEDLIYT